jgi:hypothetical protein
VLVLSQGGCETGQPRSADRGDRPTQPWRVMKVRYAIDYDRSS